MDKDLENIMPDEIEFDEEMLKKIAMKYRSKMAISVIVVIVALIAIGFAILVFAGNCVIADKLNGSATSAEEKSYSAAMSSYDEAQLTVDEFNGYIPMFRIGDKNFWGKIEVYEKLYGPVECKKILDKYYPDNKYPQQAKQIIDNAKWFAKGYTELQNIVYKTARNYAEAYEKIEEVAAENPEYPEYLVLYFHLLATQRFEESTASQIAAFKALEKSAPDEVWLYAFAGTKALIKNNELNKALRLCPEGTDTESRALRIRIHRMMGEYKEAGMLYDESRNYDVPSEALDREKLILGMLEGDARTALKGCFYYTVNLNNCKTNDMIYTLWIAAIKANDKNLEKKIADYVEIKKIPKPQEVSEYAMGTKNLTDIYLNGESELS